MILLNNTLMLLGLQIVVDTNKKQISVVIFQRIYVTFILDLPDCALFGVVPFQFDDNCRLIRMRTSRNIYDIGEPLSCRHFPEREIIFSGAVIGKSFFAGCIANALLDRDVPVLMTNFPSILNRLTGVFAEDRAAFIASLDDYSLLVIDDLGVERNTEYAMEQMFTVIDSRYRSKKPLIVTTNLKLEEIKNPPDLAHARIYDRILERCAPVLFSGKNFREEGARATKAAAKEIVSKG